MNFINAVFCTFFVVMLGGGIATSNDHQAETANTSDEQPIYGDSVSFEKLDATPWPIKGEYSLPSYPELAKRAGVAGTVTIWLRVDTSGNVSETRTIAVKPQLLGFEESTSKACSLWRFTPAIFEERAIEYWVALKFNFVKSEGVSEHKDFSKDSLWIAERMDAFADSLQQLRDHNLKLNFIPPPIEYVYQRAVLH